MPTRSFWFCYRLLFCHWTAFAQQPIRLRVDASEAPRKIYHAELTIPATPGPAESVLPKVDSRRARTHGADNGSCRAEIFVARQTLQWKRDSVEMFAFHITVPAGADSVDVKLDFVSTAEAGGFTSAASATSELAILSWNQFCSTLKETPATTCRYPPSASARRLEVRNRAACEPDQRRQCGIQDGFVKNDAGRFSGSDRGGTFGEIALEPWEPGRNTSWMSPPI